MKMLPSLLFVFALLFIGGCKSNPDSSGTFDKILEEALDQDKTQKRGEAGEELVYAPNSQEPYTGWVKDTYNNGQVRVLLHYTNGKPDGLEAEWHENGEKKEDGATDTDANMLETVHDATAVNGYSLVYTKGGTGSVNSAIKSKLREVISVKDFGAVGDGVTDDTAAIQAAIDHCGKISSRTVWDQNDKAVTWGETVTLYFPPGTYAIESALTLREVNKNLIIENAQLLATGDTWGQYEYMLKSANSNVTYITIKDSKLNCNHKCSGIHARARWRVTNCHIERVHGYGITLNGSDAWVDHCIIGQWTTFDSEFYNQSNYTGVGIYCPFNDVRITNCVVRWLYECIRIEHTNIFLSECHIFQGMENYADHNPDGTYVGRGGGTAVGRTYAPLIYVAAPDGARLGNLNHVSVNHCYLDNGTLELNDNSVRLNSCMFVANSDHCGRTLDYWVNLIAKTKGTAMRFECINPVFWVTSLKREFLKFTETGGNTFRKDYSAYAASTVNLSVADNDVIRMSKNNRFGTIGTGHSLELTNVGTSCRVAFRDDDTTDDDSRPTVGSVGDDLQLEGQDIFNKTQFLGVSNTGGAAQVAARANLAADPMFKLWEASSDGGSNYKARGRFKWDSTNNRTELRFTDDSGSYITSGSGTPERRVSAPVGSLYLRRDGGTGTTLYVKESGAGKTGWVAK